MSRSRMFGDDAPKGPDNASPRRTIVGGRPPESPSTLPPVPTGLQNLLRRAAADSSFLELLLVSREHLATDPSLGLNATERSILRAISSEQLVTMVERLTPTTPARRDFLRQSAATAAVLLGGAALAACDACSSPPVVRGAQADLPPEPVPPPVPPPEPPPQRPDSTMPPAGIRPDEVPPPEPPPESPEQAPPVRPDTPRPTRGIRPDVPPERPEKSYPTRGVRSDVPPEEE